MRPKDLPRVTTHGDALEGELDSLVGRASVIEVSPSPRSWVPLKPRVLAIRDRLGAQNHHLPRFVGFPACAMGSEYRQLPVIPSEAPSPHAPCARCAVRRECSPPRAWSDELQPFGGGGTYELWCNYHARLSDVLGIPRDRRIDDMVAAHLAAVQATTERVTLEPSVVAGDSLAPQVRLAVFHGLLPRELARARASTDASLDGFERMQRTVGDADERLMGALRALPPFRAPVGLEGSSLCKAYLELPTESPEQRRSIAEQLLAGSRSTVDLALVPWSDVMLMAVATNGHQVSLKVYIARDPSKRIFDLEPLAASDPLVELCGRRAYAVIDLLAAKASKWDLSVRHQFLPGRTLSRALRLKEASARQLDALLRHHDFRADCVAIGRRGEATTLYLELS